MMQNLVDRTLGIIERRGGILKDERCIEMFYVRVVLLNQEKGK